MAIVPAPCRKALVSLLDLMLARIGHSALAASLGVPCAILIDWIHGYSTMPDAMLIALIDLIDETGE